MLQQLRELVDVHEVVEQNVAPNDAVTLASTIAKFIPVRVMNPLPDCGLFALICAESAGASYENTAVRDDDIEPTITVIPLAPPYPEMLAHNIAVPDVHTVVPHADFPITAVGVTLTVAKFIP